MTDDGDIEDQPFRRGVLRPMECVRAGWKLIRDDYWTFFGISVVGIILGSIAPMGLLMGPAMCGIYYCLLRQMDGRRVSFDMLFRGFDYFVQSLIAILVMIVPLLILIGPAYLLFFIGMFASLPQPPQPGGFAPVVPGAAIPAGPPVAVQQAVSPLAFFVPLLGLMAWVMIVSTAIGALFIFTFPLIVDRGLSGMQAVGTSVRAVLGNIGGALGLMLLVMGLSWIGMLACYVGAFFMMPIGFAAIAVAYRQVFPPGYEDEDDPRGYGSERVEPV